MASDFIADFVPDPSGCYAIIQQAVEDDRFWFYREPTAKHQQRWSAFPTLARKFRLPADAEEFMAGRDFPDTARVIDLRTMTVIE